MSRKNSRKSSLEQSIKASEEHGFKKNSTILEV